MHSMLPVNAFQHFLVLFPLLQTSPGAPNDNSINNPLQEPHETCDLHLKIGWSYETANYWGEDYFHCNGERQSPVHIISSKRVPIRIPPLKFSNTDVTFALPLTLINSGHSVKLKLSGTKDVMKPSLSGGMLDSAYEPISLHFHWGSPGVKGSEHVIDNRAYDVEMHIVHKNIKYETKQEAMYHRDGMVVLAIMFDIVENPESIYVGLNKIFQHISSVSDYHSEVPFQQKLRYENLLGDLNTRKFYTYQGSLTTPPCCEVVTWVVFPEPLGITQSQVEPFWNLINAHHDPLIRNNRPIQPLKNRRIYYRAQYY